MSLVRHIHTGCFIGNEVVLLSNGGASALERRYDMYYLGMSLNGLDICSGFSIYTFDIEQGHVTYLCARMVLRGDGHVIRWIGSLAPSGSGQRMSMCRSCHREQTGGVFM